MFQVGDYVIYKNDVCQIKEILKNYYAGKDYYKLNPIDDTTLVIDVPTENKMGYLKEIMSKEEAEQLILKMPSIRPIECQDRLIENEYKKLMNSGKKEDLIQIIKTTYLRNAERLEAGKKIGEKDDTYFHKAEKVIYNELSISLGMSYEETKEYIIDTITKLENS